MKKTRVPHRNGKQIDIRCTGYGKDYGSYDTYIIKPPIDQDKYELLLQSTDVVVGGVTGGEERIIFEMKTVSNIQSYNPCPIIKAYHLHPSGIRNYDPYLVVDNYGRSLSVPVIDYLP
ncbi:unnamed protein product [Didymodactylos carnosus]|uniref:Uncharacterized protein n=1 Tax=Didymodactylos carnosus TaxID=1234261 RepID=A0A814MSL1_9BILA|nr:unnamed protein product [Didymodactylos carnosus]CAF3847800.1 unnamed protein product [Didymodactylos carnosus]